MKSASPKPYPDRAPFPGIRTFEAEDAAIYFGRDDETRAVIERLDVPKAARAFLVMIGASGSGKILVDLHNKNPKPFKWTKSADQILASVKRQGSADFMCRTLQQRIRDLPGGQGPHQGNQESCEL